MPPIWETVVNEVVAFFMSLVITFASLLASFYSPTATPPAEIPGSRNTSQTHTFPIAEIPPQQPAQDTALPDDTTVRDVSVQVDISIPSTEKEQSGSAFPDINTHARNALVNIFCTSESGGVLSGASGSGIVVDPRGIILTNAHIAQYFLLADYPEPDHTSCTIRTGEPAKNRYYARPLYISPSWVQENASVVVEKNPRGTGEHDFAFLLITKNIDDSPLPESFSFVPINIGTHSLEYKQETFVASYPAGFLGGISVFKDLFPVTTYASITELYTFDESHIDLFSLSGNIAAQKGSSGGGVLDVYTGHLIGLIVTSTLEEDTQDRMLNAITMGHVERSLSAEMGVGLRGYLSGNLEGRADLFDQTLAPALTELLITELEK